jgi:hypothetical protein
MFHTTHFHISQFSYKFWSPSAFSRTHLYLTTMQLFGFTDMSRLKQGLLTSSPFGGLSEKRESEEFAAKASCSMKGGSNHKNVSEERPRSISTRDMLPLHLEDLEAAKRIPLFPSKSRGRQDGIEARQERMQDLLHACRAPTRPTSTPLLSPTSTPLLSRASESRGGRDAGAVLPGRDTSRSNASGFSTSRYY